MRGSYEVPISGGLAVDTVAAGEEVAYTQSAAACGSRVDEVTGTAPQAPVPAWEEGTLVVLFDPPLPSLAPPVVELLKPGGPVVHPLGVTVDRDRTRLVVHPGEAAPDSLVLWNVWDAHGMPVGVDRRYAAAVPARPDGGGGLVLASVEYRRNSAGPLLLVRMQGGVTSFPCPVPFVLDPYGWELGPQEPAGEDLEVLLPEALATGTYTLRLAEPCLAGSSLGASRSFPVELVVFPNPLGPGSPLTLVNLEPGSRVQLLDVAGNETLSFTTVSSPEIRQVDVAPGLYFVRLLDPGGRLLTIHKLAVIR
jgi:hypothetical protein